MTGTSLGIMEFSPLGAFVNFAMLMGNYLQEHTERTDKEEEEEEEEDDDQSNTYCNDVAQGVRAMKSVTQHFLRSKHVS